MKQFLLFAITFISFNAFTQTHAHVKHEIENKSFWSKNLIPLNTDSNSSSFIVRIKSKISPHYHNHHTEILYVLQGRALMTMNDSTYKIQQGDYIHIPPNIIHSLKVTSLEWLELMSVISPKYVGHDIIKVSKKGRKED